RSLALAAERFTRDERPRLLQHAFVSESRRAHALFGAELCPLEKLVEAARDSGDAGDVSLHVALPGHFVEGDEKLREEGLRALHLRKNVIETAERQGALRAFEFIRPYVV